MFRYEFEYGFIIFFSYLLIKAIEAGQHLKALHTTPLKKIATPEDVANAVLFLSSEKAAGHLTGSTLKLHGGMEGRMLNKLEDLQK